MLASGQVEAIALFEQRLKDHEDDAGLHYRLGCMLHESGQTSAAIPQFTLALHLQPAFAQAHNSLGLSLQELRRVSEALAHFETARSLEPQLWQAHYNLGRLLQQEGRISECMQPIHESMRLRRAAARGEQHQDRQTTGTTKCKLLHDIEQIQYLVKQGILGKDHLQGVELLKAALLELEPQFLQYPGALFPPALRAKLAPTYNRLLNFHNPAALREPAVNPHIVSSDVARDYFDHHPGMTFVDDFLKPEALRELRRFCLESTIWFEGGYLGGYVGSSLEDGFICPLLIQIAEELPRSLPQLFGANRLTKMWAFKYDSQRSGIAEHADFAAINVNFWITPDDANLSPDSGGLVVWDKEAPLDWDFDAYNRDIPRIKAHLTTSGARPFIVPYKQNRVVIFNSDLFHKTDSYHFREGYENRRINITLLYGHRQ